MEGIEESQINDHSIMEATVIERQDHSGRIMFRTTLPSGRALNSEWVQESDKAKAGILWTEAVRGQIVQDSNEAALQARKTLKERRATQAAVAPSLIGTDGQTLYSPVTAPVNTAGLAAPASAIAPAADPSQYVKVQYLAAKSLSSFLSGEAARINQELTAAKKAEAQWFGLFQAMGGSVDEVVSSKGSNSNRGGSGADVVGEGRDGLFGRVVVSTSTADSLPDADDEDDEWEDDTNGALDAGR